MVPWKVLFMVWEKAKPGEMERAKVPLFATAHHMDISQIQARLVP